MTASADQGKAGPTQGGGTEKPLGVLASAVRHGREFYAVRALDVGAVLVCDMISYIEIEPGDVLHLQRWDYDLAAAQRLTGVFRRLDDGQGLLIDAAGNEHDLQPWCGWTVVRMEPVETRGAEWDETMRVEERDALCRGRFPRVAVPG